MPVPGPARASDDPNRHRPNRAELHFHLLPCVDDGPETMEESLELAAMAIRDGTSTVVATPHVHAIELDELPEHVRRLRRRLRDAGLALDVRCGGELAHDDVATVTDAQLDSIAHGPPGARWVLLEAPLPATGADGEDFRSAAAELRARGFAVLIAHPERSDAVFADGAVALRDELAAGSLLQVNATSLTGEHGEGARARGLRLARDGHAAVVSSDAHRPTRGPALAAALRTLVEGGVDARFARDMTDVAPRAVLDRGLEARRGRGAHAATRSPSTL
jgi:protein-tyrosine phosphatase